MKIGMSGMKMVKTCYFGLLAHNWLMSCTVFCNQKITSYSIRQVLALYSLCGSALDPDLAKGILCQSCLLHVDFPQWLGALCLHVNISECLFRDISEVLSE